MAIEARKPDNIMEDIKSVRSLILQYHMIIERIAKNIENYQNLARELKRLWKTKKMIVPVLTIITGPKLLSKKLKDVGN